MSVEINTEPEKITGEPTQNIFIYCRGFGIRAPTCYQHPLKQRCRRYQFTGLGYLASRRRPNQFPTPSIIPGDCALYIPPLAQIYP
jgi:hypothetical protein